MVRPHESHLSLKSPNKTNVFFKYILSISSSKVEYEKIINSLRKKTFTSFLLWGSVPNSKEDFILMHGSFNPKNFNVFNNHI